MLLTTGLNCGIMGITKITGGQRLRNSGDFLYPNSRGIRAENILNIGQASNRALIASPAFAKLKWLLKTIGGPMRRLTFNGHTLTAIQRNNNLFLTSKELAKGLGYKDDDSVRRIYARHSDEFTPEMTCGVKLTPQLKGTVKLTAPCGGSQLTRVFSPRGCHLIAMFAKTPFAKEFRKWVLDVLEKEALANRTVQTQPSLFEEKPESKPKQVKVSLPEAKEVKEAVESYGRKCYTFGILQEMMDSGKLVKTADGKIEFNPEGR